MIRSQLKTKQRRSAYHEAGHAVLLMALGMEVKGVSIIEDENSTGSVRFSGGNPREGSDEEAIQIHAPEAYWLRLATAMYASSEAVRLAGYNNPREGAGAYHVPESDYGKAGEYINRITTASDCIAQLCLLAQRRSKQLVKYYWPEIELVADALVKSGRLNARALNRLYLDSILKRNARQVIW